MELFMTQIGMGAMDKQDLENHRIYLQRLIESLERSTDVIERGAVVAYITSRWSLDRFAQDKKQES